MRPAFSDALYYPTIDIKNNSWLKTAIIFWDSISTIVPENIVQPYKQYDTQYLFDVGFLRPLYVNSNDKSVVGIEKDIIDLMHSPEFLHALNTSYSKEFVQIWSNRMSYNMRNFFTKHIGQSEVPFYLLNKIKTFKKYLDETEIYYFNNGFAYIYMTILANRLCEAHSLGMITDDIPHFNINNIVRIGNQTVIPNIRLYERHPRYLQFEQGLLLNLIMNGITISPDTSISDIMMFKSHHQDELSRFKTEISKLTQDFAIDIPIDAIQKEIQDLYKNDFIPAYNDFKAALTSSRIKWFTESLFKISILSTSVTSVPMALLGMPVEQALLAGIGISIITSTVSYNVNKKNFLRNSPYSYLFSIKHELT